MTWQLILKNPYSKKHRTFDDWKENYVPSKGKGTERGGHMNPQSLQNNPDFHAFRTENAVSRMPPHIMKQVDDSITNLKSLLQTFQNEGVPSSKDVNSKYGYDPLGLINTAIGNLQQLQTMNKHEHLSDEWDHSDTEGSE